MDYFIKQYLKIYNFWIKIPEKIRFLLVGGYNTVVSYVLYMFLVYVEMEPQVALFLSFIISSVNSYLTQKFFVFLTRGDYIKEYIKCLSTWIGGYVFNAILLFVFLDVCGINAYIAQLICLIILTLYSYCFLKYFAFRTKKQKEIKKLK